MSIPIFDAERQKAIAAKWRRERIAVAAMQGMLASSRLEATTSCREMAEEAVAIANALIRVLDRDEK